MESWCDHKGKPREDFSSLQGFFFYQVLIENRTAIPPGVYLLKAKGKEFDRCDYIVKH